MSKQTFALCFALQKTVFQVYEIEATWETKTNKPATLEVVGLKFFLNCMVDEVSSNLTNYGIDGICVELMTKDGYGWFSFPRTRVTDFFLQNNVSFNYYTRLTFSKKDKVMEGLIIESRLTDTIRRNKHID